MPPMKGAMPMPTSGGGAAATDVAGAAGGGATTVAVNTTAPAAAVGVGDLSGLLKQLTDAVALLGKAIASMQGGAVGGGGPIQMPPGKGVVIQGGGGSGTNNPQVILRGRLDKADTLATLSPTAKAALAPLRAELTALDAKAAQTGTSDAGAVLRLGASIDSAVLPANDPRLPQLAKVIAEARALEAQAVKQGSYNAVEIQRLSGVYQAIMSQGPPAAA